MSQFRYLDEPEPGAPGATLPPEAIVATPPPNLLFDVMNERPDQGTFAARFKRFLEWHYATTGEIVMDVLAVWGPITNLPSLGAHTMPSVESVRVNNMMTSFVPVVALEQKPHG